MPDIIMGEYNSTSPTFTGGTHAVQLDANGNLKITNVVPKKFTIISTTSPVYIGRNANDTILYGLVISAALTGTCVINGFFDSAGNEQIYTLPAATPAGYKDFGGVINNAKALTVTCSSSSDDNLVGVVYTTI